MSAHLIKAHIDAQAAYKERARKVPAGARPLSHVIMARGEVSGHSHRIAERGAAHLYEVNGVLYLDVVAALATLIHEEHGPITLPQGRYRVWIQREYAPGEIRRVYD